jgi:hypothetical protein
VTVEVGGMSKGRRFVAREDGRLKIRGRTGEHHLPEDSERAEGIEGAVKRAQWHCVATQAKSVHHQRPLVPSPFPPKS